MRSPLSTSRHEMRKNGVMTFLNVNESRLKTLGHLADFSYISKLHDFETT